VFIQVAFQQMVVELYAISSYLNFKLPVDSTAINQQVRQLLLVEQRLQLIEEEVMRLFGVGQSSRAHRAYHTLIELTEQMRLAAMHLRLLTEECLIDPEGAESCFQAEAVKQNELLNQIKSLKLASNWPAKALE